MINFYKIGNKIYKENEEGLYETSSIKEMYDENKRLNNRIDKAIEYIEWNLEANEEVIEYMNYDGNFKKVLDILKGEKNE